MQNSQKEQKRKLSSYLDKNVSEYPAFNLPEHDMNSLVSPCQKIEELLYVLRIHWTEKGQLFEINCLSSV